MLALIVALAASPLAAQPASLPRSSMLDREEAALREEFGAVLQFRPIDKRGVLNPGKMVLPVDTELTGDAARVERAADPKDPFAGQLRLIRDSDADDIQNVAYELYRGRVYRVRWRLAPRFERPLMASLIEHLKTKFGEPYYDQLIEGKFGTGRATLRRTGWRKGLRGFEVRQLNPGVGGPIFLTLSNHATVQAIAKSGGTAAPEPDSIGPWWQKPLKPFASLAAPERDALLAAFDAVLTQVDWE